MAGAYRVNATYGFDVELVIEDTGSEAQGATTAATNLVAAGVEVVVGAAASGASLAAAAVLVPEEIPLVSYASTFPELTDYDDNDFLFRNIASDVFQGQALAQLAVNKGISAPITINRDDDYGNGVVEEFTKKFKDLTGSDPVDSIVYNPSTTSFSSQVTQINDSSADGVVIVAFPPDAVAIFTEAQTQNVNLKWLATDSIAFTYGVVNDPAIKAYLTGKLYGTTPTSGTNPGGGSLWAQLQADLTASGGSLGSYGDYAYDALLVVGAALNHAGVYDGPTIRNSLYPAANDLVGATSPNKAFNCAGEPIIQSYDYWNATNGVVKTETAPAVYLPDLGTPVPSRCPIININSPSDSERFGITAPNYDLSIIGLYETIWYTLDGGLINITASGLTGHINETEWDKLADGSVIITFYANKSDGYVNSAQVQVTKNTATTTSTSEESSFPTRTSFANLFVIFAALTIFAVLIRRRKS